jgi:hypothetical protein
VDTVIADAIYMQDANWGFTLEDVFIKNHAIAFHQVNGWEAMLRNVSIRFFRDYGIYTEANANVGSGIGADQFLESVNVSEAGSTGTITDTGCAVRYANWSGIFIHQLTTTSAKYGLCLQPRAQSGVETFTNNFYGTISDSKLDTSEHDGILIDSSINGVAGANASVSDIRFTNTISAFNGCTPGCNPVNPFPNAANGVHLLGSNTKNVSFIGGTTRENGGHGVFIEGTPAQVTFLGFDADSNSQAANNTYDGFHLANGVFDVRVGFSFTGRVNTTLTRTPRWGIFAGTGGDNLQIGQVRFIANTTGTMSYSGGANSLIGPNWPLTDSAINQLRPATISFATMSAFAATNGTQVFCYDCTSTCTAGAGGGRTCFRESSAWTH